MNIGNSLINIHRAHRYEAAQEEVKRKRGVNLLFTGLVGGEYFKETYYDNVSIPSFIFQYKNEDKNNRISLIKKTLIEKGLKPSNIDIKKIEKDIQEFLSISEGFSRKKEKFLYTYYYYGCTHHSQDSSLFLDSFDFLVNPYMDIDFLESISKSKYWHLNRKQTFLSKLFQSYFLVSITYYLAGRLGKVKYAKRGAYSPYDMVKRPMLYFFKRLKYLIVNDKKKYPSSFPIGDWLVDFIHEHLDTIPPELECVFDMKALKERFHKAEFNSNETYWHLFTNPINIKMNYEHYTKG